MLKMLVSNFLYDGQNLDIEIKSTVKPMLESASFGKWYPREDSNLRHSP